MDEFMKTEVNTVFKTMSEIYKDQILKRINFYGGNKAKVAMSLGITIKTLYNKLGEFDLEHLINSKRGRKREDRTTHKNITGLPGGLGNGAEYSNK